MTGAACADAADDAIPGQLHHPAGNALRAHRCVASQPAGLVPLLDITGVVGHTTLSTVSIKEWPTPCRTRLKARADLPCRPAAARLPAKDRRGARAAHATAVAQVAPGPTTKAVGSHDAQAQHALLCAPIQQRQHMHHRWCTRPQPQP